MPEGVLDNVAAAAGKAEVLAGKVKNKAIVLLDDIINFVNKSCAELKKFFDDLFAKIKKWLLKNKRVAWMSSSLFKFGDDATTIANYIRLSKRTEDGWRNILCHGTSKSVIINNIHYKPEKFAKLLIEQGYQKGTPIRLIACNTGSKSNGFAQKLAKELETKVLAPTDKIRVDDWGEFIIHNKGKFIEFK